MNMYERVQRSIDFIEAHLAEEFTLEECAREAFMSLSGYHSMFLSVVGYHAKEYIRLRRLTLACDELLSTEETIAAIAVKYGYNSPDSFTRAFRSRYGVTPSRAKRLSPAPRWIRFERMNVMDRTDNRELAEKYPDIKVIRQLEPMKTACFTYFGDAPEDHAFAALRQWAHENGLRLGGEGCRVFGYNNPDPSDPAGDETYGYEVCVTVPDRVYDRLEDIPDGFVRGTYDSVKRRTLSGGKFAVLSVRRDATGEVGGEIMKAWQRFTAWLHESKYIWGGAQYLEEHLGFGPEDEHIGGVDLYISVQDAPREAAAGMQREEIPAYRAAVFRTEGADPERNARESWARALTFAKEHRLPAESCRIFRYDKGFDRKPPFFFTVLITLPEGLLCPGQETIVFPGGSYMTCPADPDHIAEGWMQMEKWRKESHTIAGNHQWVEEWQLENWDWPCLGIKLCYPVME